MPSANPSPTSHGDLENRYYAYLRQQSLSSTESLLGVLRFYLPYLEQSHRVLDIGCGHGEFLEMLTAAGHEAVGMDIDPGMVAACRAKGLDVTEADVLEWLPRSTCPGTVRQRPSAAGTTAGPAARCPGR